MKLLGRELIKLGREEGLDQVLAVEVASSIDDVMVAKGLKRR